MFTRFKDNVKGYIKWSEEKANTRGRRIALYLFFASWLVWPTSLMPFFGFHNMTVQLVLFLTFVLLSTPWLIVGFRDTKKLKAELFRQQVKLIVHETILELISPQEYERMMKAREVNKLFNKKK